MLTPVRVDLPDYQPDDRRICHLLGTAEEEPAIVIVGFPSDAGVTRNGGRPGAALGPDAIRDAFYRMTPGSAGDNGLYARVRDLGNVDVKGDVGEDQKALAETVAPYLNAETICVVLGGGHETTYGHYLGYVANDAAPRIVNWDAHADVRSPANGGPTSGSSFYLALNHQTHPTPQYTVCGLLPHAVAPAHVALLRERNCPRYWRADLTGEVIDEIYADASQPTLVSFDLDAVDQALAPGVSAPAVGGLDTATWLQAAYGAGVSSSVSSIDICELNPLFDIDGHTARLAALTLWTFLSGCAARLGIQRFIRSR